MYLGGRACIRAVAARCGAEVRCGQSVPETARLLSRASVVLGGDTGPLHLARALGRPGLSFEWDAVRAIVTRYDSTQQAEFAALMQAYLGTVLSPYRQDFTALVGQAGEQVAGIYEADYRDFNRETYVRGRAAFDDTWAAVKRLLIGAWRRDEIGAEAAAE